MVNAAGDTGPRSTGRQQLAAELRKLRDLAGVSGRELANKIGISQSKVSRIESSTAMPSLPEVTAWADALEVSDEVRERLVTMTEAAFTEVHPWRAALQRRGHFQDDVQELETQAGRVCTFQSSLVPGLLQTAEYARRVLSMSQLPYAAEDFAAAVAARLHRQLAIYEEDRTFDFLITEAALRWCPGPSRLLLAQIDRISSVSTLDNVTIGLIPYGVDAVAPIPHSFIIYDGYGDHEGVVAVEAVHASMKFDGTENLALYHGRWALLRQMAVFGDEARKFLAALSAEIHHNSG
jgi:transcriptional regulator with XRE-family HTH domain